MLDNKDIVPCCTGMIQKEVAERIAAGPGSKTYGILSVLIQAWYKVEYLFTVSEHVFNPPPKVKSAVIRMILFNKRPEQLSVAEFIDLTNKVEEALKTAGNAQ